MLRLHPDQSHQNPRGGTQVFIIFSSSQAGVHSGWGPCCHTCPCSFSPHFLSLLTLLCITSSPLLNSLDSKMIFSSKGKWPPKRKKTSQMECLIFCTVAVCYQRRCGMDFIFLLHLKALHEINGLFQLLQENSVSVDTQGLWTRTAFLKMWAKSPGLQLQITWTPRTGPRNLPSNRLLSDVHGLETPEATRWLSNRWTISIDQLVQKIRKLSPMLIQIIGGNGFLQRVKIQ